ncbi:MAG TPA: sensor histidine kinase [Tenuifilaceae bacterium]|nr:sensor histidine kinase [Tenuifilaceae bacterium]HRX67233.1 sensor histidine kinase [Tenuifilaceae bacterium]
MIIKRTIILSISLFAILWQACKPVVKTEAGSVFESDSLYVMKLADSLWYLSSQGDTVQAFQVNSLLLSIADTLPHSITKGDAYRTSAMFYNDIVDFENALKYYNLSEAIFETFPNEVGEQYLARTWLNMSYLFFLGDDYASAIEYCTKAEPIFLKYEMNRHLINLYSKMGEFQDRLNDSIREKNYHQEVIKLANKANDWFSLGSAYNTYATYLMQQKRTEESLEYLEKVKHIADSTGFTQFSVAYFINKGYIEANINNNQQAALKIYFEGLNFARKSGSAWELADMLERISRTYIKLNNPNLAIKYAQESLELSKKYGIMEHQRRLTETLFNAYQMTGNYKKANEFVFQYLELQKKFFSSENKKQINFLNAKNEAQRREIRIANLELEKRVSEAALSRRTLMLFISLTIAFAGLIVTLLLYRNHRQQILLTHRELELRERKILDLEREKELAVAQSTIKGEEAERSRIARELHDGLGGLLTVARLNLSNMQGNHFLNEENANAFQNALELIDSSVKELRRVAHNMMPEILHKNGLNSAIENFCTSLNSDDSPLVSYNFFGEDFRFSNALELTVYRTAQELINNSIKHSLSPSVEVQLLLNTTRLCLTVTDFGVGFDPAKMEDAKGNGLPNIRSRVSSFGGKLEVNSSPGKGTEVVVEFDNPQSIKSND